MRASEGVRVRCPYLVFRCVCVCVYLGLVCSHRLSRSVFGGSGETRICTLLFIYQEVETVRKHYTGKCCIFIHLIISLNKLQ